MQVPNICSCPKHTSAHFALTIFLCFEDYSWNYPWGQFFNLLEKYALALLLSVHWHAASLSVITIWAGSNWTKHTKRSVCYLHIVGPVPKLALIWTLHFGLPLQNKCVGVLPNQQLIHVTLDVSVSNSKRSQVAWCINRQQQNKNWPDAKKKPKNIRNRQDSNLRGETPIDV